MAVQYDLSHYYRQREGAIDLSPTLQSSELWTPQQLPLRLTVSPQRYQEYRLSTPVSSRLPWGREREYGGIGPVSLPDDHRPKAEPPPVEAKGHKHFGYGGDPWPRGLPIEQYYDITTLKKSAVRVNDELCPKPPAASINEKQIYVAFPAEHPYHSHISKFAVFPSFRPPEESTRSGPPLHPQTPARPHSAIILKKTKGNPYRHEVIYTPSESHKEALTWPGQQGYFHYPKCQENDQTYYPMPPKTMAPNTKYTSPEETANLQRFLEKSQWLTTYKRSFTDRGEMNPLQLDDFQEKVICKNRGPEDVNTEMKQTFLSTILEARPLEGRIARLRDGRRSLYSREGVLDNAPESQSAKHNIMPLLSAVENGTDKPTFSMVPDMPNVDTLAMEEKEYKCSSTERRQNKQPMFCKITDTEQSDALYKRQLTPLPCPFPETDQKCNNSVFYEDLPPSRKEQYIVFENPYGLSKPWLQNDSDQKQASILKGQESQGVWSHCDKQNLFIRSAPGADQYPHNPLAGASLLELQASFSKSDANKVFHQQFPEKTKDLRENHYSGKKHQFYGLHSFYFHN
ncbi:sperm-associated microtubule inner protein 4 [Discoglossus pictus]